MKPHGPRTIVICCQGQNQSQVHYFLKAADANTAISQLLSPTHQTKMTEVQEPEIGVYDFRDFSPWRSQSTWISPGSPIPRSLSCTSPRQDLGNFSPPLNLVGLHASHFLNFPLDLTLGLDPSYSQKWLYSFHEKYQNYLYKKATWK